jgi:IS1 family transposase
VAGFPLAWLPLLICLLGCLVVAARPIRIKANSSEVFPPEPRIVTKTIPRLVGPPESVLIFDESMNPQNPVPDIYRRGFVSKQIKKRQNAAVGGQYRTIIPSLDFVVRWRNFGKNVGFVLNDFSLAFGSHPRGSLSQGPYVAYHPPSSLWWIIRQWLHFSNHPRPLAVSCCLYLETYGDDGYESKCCDYCGGDCGERFTPLIRISGGALCIGLAIFFAWCAVYKGLLYDGVWCWLNLFGFAALCCIACWGLFSMVFGRWRWDEPSRCQQDQSYKQEPHIICTRISVPRKLTLTMINYRGTVIAIGDTAMANVLPMEKKVAVISALAEGTGIRQTERITGVNRETIMYLGVRVGKGCQALLDQKMRDLPCRHLQFDEIWGFIGKKERHLRPDDDPTLGDVWTFCAIDSDTKIVPSFKVGKRNGATANAFVADVASRMANRVQISSDALKEYVDAIELSFGSDVDFAQIIKTYTHDDSIIAERKFSAPEVVTTEKRRVIGRPNMRLASTSHIERLNGTTRLHMRRLTRLTYAFSKRFENFEAATALHFAYYNFVKRHNSLRVTPAMEAGIERDFLTVANLVETAA